MRLQFEYVSFFPKNTVKFHHFGMIKEKKKKKKESFVMAH